MRWLAMRMGEVAGAASVVWAEGYAKAMTTPDTCCPCSRTTGSLLYNCSSYRIPTKYVYSCPVARFPKRNPPWASVCPGVRCISCWGPLRISIIRCAATPCPSRWITPLILPYSSAESSAGHRPSHNSPHTTPNHQCTRPRVGDNRPERPGRRS